MQKRFFQKINTKILTIMLVLFAITGIAVSLLTFVNLRNIYGKNFTERVLLSNGLIASLIDGDDIEKYVDLMRNQDDRFKSLQTQFHHNRAELFNRREAGASGEAQAYLLSQLSDFHNKMDSLKTAEYLETLNNLRQLTEISRSKYVYIFADTGVTAADGTKLYTCIFDTQDNEVNINPEIDGLGTTYSDDGLIAGIYETKEAPGKVMHHNSRINGEFYFAYSPVFNSDGDVIAILGTYLELSEMHREIFNSMFMFNALFFGFVIIIILVIYIFLKRYVTDPLTELTDTAHKLADGDIHAPIPLSALKQQNELGLLANVISEMTDAYKSMIINRVILDSNPFSCIIFDENCNIIDCNPRALKLYRFNTMDEFCAGFHDLLKASTPKYQPNGRESTTLEDKIKTTFKQGDFEFDTYLCLFGKLTPFNTIMKLIMYKNKPAVVVYQFDLTSQKEIQQKLEYRGNLLQAVSDISDLLLTVETVDFETVLGKAFEIIGRASLVDRVYIWRNHSDKDGRMFMTQLYEWSPDAEPQQGNRLTKSIPYDKIIPTWKETLLKGQCLNSLVKDLDDAARAHLSAQDVVSILIVPIFIQDRFWGFIGFDDCKKERIFTILEEGILRTCGYMFMDFSNMIQNEVARKLIATSEEALTTARTKSNFLANMSHEIRTPMNAILGMTELILHEKTSDSVFGYASDIKNACRGLLVLINDILDISKIESGKLHITPVRYQSASLLMDVISIIKMRLDKKGISFIVNIDANLPCELIGDETRVKQILINLLSNAVKFTHEGSITLNVSGEIIGEFFMMKCSVTDTGIGIRQEDMDKLFESFYQIDTRKNRNIEGTGLGLSISKQLAEMMGGSITVESEYDVGSTFTAVIRQDITNADPMVTLKNPEKTSVLVYENRSVYLSSISHALDSLNCNYKVCSNQSEFEDALNAFKFDYIFVSSLYVKKTQALAAQKQPNAMIVSLSGDSSLPVENNILTISMPIHCMQIVNILNNEYGRLQVKPGGNTGKVGMIAPDAKVLVVDDNIVNLKVASGLLKIFGIKADTSASGARAIEMVKKTEYDLVFMDHMMPDMDGIDTTVAIRKLEGKRFGSLPIIALTANAISGAKEMFKAEGLNDYLAKPIEMSKLNAVLKEWIPKEKQQTRTIENDANKITDFEVTGLNTQKGITYSGGVLQNYLDILETYASDGKRRLAEIEESFEKSDFKTLNTYIHALKSASANIGADDISGMAAELESAYKNGDITFISKNIKFFTDDLSCTLANIRCCLDVYKKGSGYCEKSSDIEFLKQSLTKINENFDSVDIESIEQILKDLRTYNWSVSITSLLDKMENYVNFFDYDGIERVLQELDNVLINS